MRSSRSMGFAGRVCLLAGMGLAASVFRADAGGNMDSTNKYAWSENAGWVNFAPATGGVTVTLVPPRAGYLSGHAWAENIGWIKLGSDSGGPYLNTAADNWGVNLDGNAFSGFAWSETFGWIRFNPTNHPVTISPDDGRFDGYAWGENIGWIHFRNASPAYSVQTDARWPGVTLIIFR